MKKFLFLIPFLLIACTVPKTPAQTIYSIESDYAAALQLELVYDALPKCGLPNSSVLCSTPDVAKGIRKSDDAAWAAIQAAQTAVRTPGFDTNKTTAIIASATALTQSFVNITNALGVR